MPEFPELTWPPELSFFRPTSVQNPVQKSHNPKVEVSLFDSSRGGLDERNLESYGGCEHLRQTDVALNFQGSGVSENFRPTSVQNRF